MMPLVAILESSKILVTDQKSKLEKSILGDLADVQYFCIDEENNIPDRALQAEVLLVWHHVTLDAGIMEQLTNCKAIIRNGVGYESVDLQAASRQGIPVCNIPDYGTEEVADHAMALALTLCRQILPLKEASRKLNGDIPCKSKMQRLRGSIFAIIGLGRIGTATALRAKVFGFSVIFYDPYLPNGVDKALGLTRVKSLHECLIQADVLSIHCPETNETHHMIAEREIALMKKSAFIVNTARGGIISKSAILQALTNGNIAGAGLDVVENEPLKTIEEAETPNLICTNHAAFYSGESMEEMRRSSSMLARKAILGQTLENIVKAQP